MLLATQVPPLEQGWVHISTVTSTCVYIAFLYINVNLLPCSHLSPLHPCGHVQSPKASQDPLFRHCVSKLVLVDCVLCDIVSYLEGMWHWVVERDNNKWTVEDSRSHCHTETRCTGLNTSGQWISYFRVMIYLQPQINSCVGEWSIAAPLSSSECHILLVYCFSHNHRWTWHHQ